MKKFLKIFGITLLSTVGTLVVLVGVVIGVLCYVIFTPEKLTPVVKEVAAPFIKGEFDIERVNLTFLSTFPDAGLDIHGLTILSPMEGAQSDTLVHIPLLRAGIDAQAAIDGHIHVHVFELKDIVANAYISPDSIANYDILNLPESEDEEEVETEGGWRLESIELDDKLVATARRVSYVDATSQTQAELEGVQLSALAKDLNGHQPKLHLNADIAALSAIYEGEKYAERLAVRVDFPVCACADTLFIVDGTKLEVNQFCVAIDGRVGYWCLSRPDYRMDLTLATNTWNLTELLALVPKSIFTMPDSIEADADMELKARVYGEYHGETDSCFVKSMPLVDAELMVTNAQGAYLPLPYVAEEVKANILAHVDLNDESKTYVDVKSLSTRVKHSKLAFRGMVRDIFDDIRITGKADVQVQIPDFKYFIPESMVVKGEADGMLNLDIRMSEIDRMALRRGTVSGDVNLHQLDVAMLDSLGEKSMTAVSDDIRMHLVVPTGCSLENLAAEAQIRMSDMDFRMADGMQALLGKTHLDLSGEYDTKDTTAIPTLKGSFDFSSLQVTMDTIEAYLQAPRGRVNLSGTRRDKSEPRLAASLEMDSLYAKMGSLAQANTSYLGVKASARHRKGKDNLLLTWNPRLDFDIQRVVAKTSMLPMDVIVPEIKFNYSNKDFTIDTSRVELGRSDFALTGSISNIGPYLDNKGLLTGELRFTSNHADVNELLDLVNGLGNDEDELNVEEPETDTLRLAINNHKETDPFIVPKGVDMSIYTMIDTAYAFGQTVRHVGGQVNCKDGVMTIEEMGFLCEAARMQLTGIYRTPRRNHLFAGLDFHMTDIRIAELIEMVPQVDSVLPMLRSFKGQAEVHLAAETYLTANYDLKPSTTRGAVSIAAQDLTLLDGETFTKIAKILTFKKQSENKIDSISAEMSLYKKQVTVYPFLIHYDRWKVAAGGEHNLAGNFDYHVSLLKPLRIGVDVKSKVKKNGDTGFDIRPVKCKYAEDFAPVQTKVVETNAMSVRKLIATALRKNEKLTEESQNEN